MSTHRNKNCNQLYIKSNKMSCKVIEILYRNCNINATVIVSETSVATCELYNFFVCRSSTDTARKLWNTAQQSPFSVPLFVTARYKLIFNQIEPIQFLICRDRAFLRNKLLQFQISTYHVNNGASTQRFVATANAFSRY